MGVALGVSLDHHRCILELEEPKESISRHKNIRNNDNNAYKRKFVNFHHFPTVRMDVAFSA